MDQWRVFRQPGVMEYISGDMTVWELEPLQKLASDGMVSL
jgi:hypothetical protein